MAPNVRRYHHMGAFECPSGGLNDGLNVGALYEAGGNPRDCGVRGVRPIRRHPT